MFISFGEKPLQVPTIESCFLLRENNAGVTSGATIGRDGKDDH